MTPLPISGTNENAPQTMGDVFTILEKLKAIDPETSRKMKKAVGFRNVAIHNYQAISWETVYAICDKSLDDFRNFAKSINLYSTPNG